MYIVKKSLKKLKNKKQIFQSLYSA